MIAELDALLRRGWGGMVFIVDDNFIGNKRTKTLLRELVAWRERTSPHDGFLTEASLNLADDPELRELMVQAGFRKVFVGIETPWRESLSECNKVQNKRRDLVAAVRTLQNAGLQVLGGFIVGFDSDTPEIFELQFEFIQGSGVGTAMVGLLTAVPRPGSTSGSSGKGGSSRRATGTTPTPSSTSGPRWTVTSCWRGYRALMRRLYEPRVYYRRCRTFWRAIDPPAPA